MRVQGAKRNPKLVDTNTVTVNISNGEKARIHNVFIIDASGSMSGSKYKNAINGVNEVLVDIKKDTDTINTVTIVEFEGDTISRRLDMENSNVLPDTYQAMGTGGMTPLNEAVGETLEYILKERNSKFSKEDKVLVNVFTDGEENASHGKYRNGNVLGEFIKSLENDGFTITFMGTQSEVQYAISTLNLMSTNTLVHTNTASSVKMSYDTTLNARKMYSKSVSRGEDVKAAFYSKTVESEKK